MWAKTAKLNVHLGGLLLRVRAACAGAHHRPLSAIRHPPGNRHE
jgi:hypothetical protein